MDPETWNLLIINRVIVQQDLVVYLEYFIWNETYHNITHTIYGQFLCYNHCLLKCYECVALSHVLFFLIEYTFFTFDQGLWKGSTVS